MVDHLRFHAVMVLGLQSLGMICYWLWLRRQVATNPAHRQLVKRSTRRPKDSKLFPGLTTKPPWVACEQAQARVTPPPGAPPLDVWPMPNPFQTVSNHRRECLP